MAAPPPGIPEALWARIRKGVDALAGADRVRVLCHYDGDGATAAAVLARAFWRWGKTFQISLTSVLDDATASRVRGEGDGALGGADRGSGQLDAVGGLARAAVVLDHHRPPRDSERVVHVNPHLAGIDGAHGAGGATLAGAFAPAVGE